MSSTVLPLFNDVALTVALPVFAAVITVVFAILCVPSKPTPVVPVWK